MSTNDVQEELRDIAFRLQSIAARLAQIGGEAAEPPPDARVMAETRICLWCKKPIPEGERPLRGLHSTCYRTARREIQLGKYTDSELIESGVLLPVEKAGRKPGATTLAVEDRVKAAGPRLAEITVETPTPTTSKPPEKP